MSDSETRSLDSKKAPKGISNDLSKLDTILDRPCQIHGTSEKHANHSKRNFWVIKQVGKLNAEDSGKSLHSDDDDEPRRPNNGGQKPFPSKVKMVSMICAARIPKKERK